MKDERHDGKNEQREVEGLGESHLGRCSSLFSSVFHVSCDDTVLAPLEDTTLKYHQRAHTHKDGSYSFTRRRRRNSTLHTICALVRVPREIECNETGLSVYLCRAAEKTTASCNIGRSSCVSIMHEHNPSRWQPTGEIPFHADDGYEDDRGGARNELARGLERATRSLLLLLQLETRRRRKEGSA